jgi:hypothetical protein
MLYPAELRARKSFQRVSRTPNFLGTVQALKTITEIISTASIIRVAPKDQKTPPERFGTGPGWREKQRIKRAAQFLYAILEGSWGCSTTEHLQAAYLLVLFSFYLGLSPRAEWFASSSARTIARYWAAAVAFF